MNPEDKQRIKAIEERAKAAHSGYSLILGLAEEICVTDVPWLIQKIRELQKQVRGAHGKIRELMEDRQ